MNNFIFCFIAKHVSATASETIYVPKLEYHFDR